MFGNSCSILLRDLRRLRPQWCGAFTSRARRAIARVTTSRAARANPWCGEFGMVGRRDQLVQQRDMIELATLDRSAHRVHFATDREFVHHPSLLELDCAPEH